MSTANDPWGRVADDGTVYVRTAEGERVVGSWQAGSPDEALAFYRRKYEALETEITLLEQRITTTDLSPGRPGRPSSGCGRRWPTPTRSATWTRCRPGWRRCPARWTPPEEVRAARDQARVRGQGRQGADRRRGRADRGRGDPLEDQRGADAPAAGGVEGRAAGRPGGGDRAVEAAVGRAQRLRQAPQGLLRRAGRGARGTAQVPQGEAGIEAEALASSTDWAATAAAYRDLMRSWKAGRAGRPDRRGGALEPVQGRPGHRSSQARSEVYSAKDERAARARGGQVPLLEEAGQAGPGDRRPGGPGGAARDPGALGAGGPGAPEAHERLEQGLRRIEDAVRKAEDAQWRRSNPEALARAQGTVEQIRSAIGALEAQLAKARAERRRPSASDRGRGGPRRPPLLARRSRTDPGRALRLAPLSW